MLQLCKTKSAKKAVRSLDSKARAILHHGKSLELLKSLPAESIQLTISSPPYCMGKEYEESSSPADFLEAHRILLPEIARITVPGGSICWQVGYHVKNQEIFPLDYAIYEVIRSIPELVLRNRIVWTYGHGLHGRSRFSGRHEVILWFTKGVGRVFDLDSVRVPQKYPGKRHYKGPKKGDFSGNPLGKNPGDVWEIPNVKGNHIEKTIHPCQFPVALAQRLVRALSKTSDIVCDPFMGSGSTGVAALLDGRRFIGSEVRADYVSIAEERINAAIAGVAKVRPIDLPIYVPRAGSSVATVPEHFTQG